MTLQNAFDAARRDPSQPVVVSDDHVERRYALVDAYAASGRANPSMVGQLVLREVRLSREYEADDPALDTWRVGGEPRHHWGFIVPKAEGQGK